MSEVINVIDKFLKLKMNSENEQFWQGTGYCLWSRSLSSMKLSRSGGNR